MLIFIIAVLLGVAVLTAAEAKGRSTLTASLLGGGTAAAVVLILRAVFG